MSTGLDPKEAAAEQVPKLSRDEQLIKGLEPHGIKLRREPSKKKQAKYVVRPHQPKRPKPCKECNGEDRLPGSSRGARCKQAWQVKLGIDAKLEKRARDQVAAK